MNGQPERCDRTAYVSGLQPTVTDIELFEIFNRVAHVEKVIVRSGSVRHALIVFKTVEGLYQALLNFQGTTLHSRQLHIRPLRDSSHNGGQPGQQSQHRQSNCQKASYRPSSAQDHPQYSSYNRSHHQHQNSYYQNSAYQPRGYRNSSGSASSYGQPRRRYGYNRNGYQNETYSGGGYEDNRQYAPAEYHHNQFRQTQNSAATAQQHNFHFEDHAEGAKRFDNLANLIRATTPTDPFIAPTSANFQKSSDSSTATTSPPSIPRSRSTSSTTAQHQKHPPPAWKMELDGKWSLMAAKREAAAAKSEVDSESSQEAPPSIQELSMSQQKFLAQIVRQAISTQQQEPLVVAKEKKQRPNLSVINPALFYEQYPRTSSPVIFAPSSTSNMDKAPSPHDPAVLAYSRLRVPQSAFDALSPIDTNNCSFITKHLGSDTTTTMTSKRDLTNEELSDMIVSTGNLRIMPAITDSYETPPKALESPESIVPAPWSPLKRLRAESGSLSAAPLASPQFSPIQLKLENSEKEEEEVEDDVFARSSEIQKEEKALLAEQKMSEFEDINNSRLPSNSHSAAPSSEQKSFVFPEYPMCRHSSVPSIAHLVGDLSDFCPPSPHFAVGGGEKKCNNEEESKSTENSESIDKTSEEQTSLLSSEDVVGKVQDGLVV